MRILAGEGRGLHGLVRGVGGGVGLRRHC
jgi:hypothetical protein